MKKFDDQEIEEKILKVLGNYMDIEGELKMDDHLDDLGLDSFKAIYLLLDLEEEFQIQIPDTMLSPEIFASPEALKMAINTVLE